MTTQLDRKIQQLQQMVEERLNLCQAARGAVRCTLPGNHPLTTPHRFGPDPAVVQPSAARQLIEEICNGEWVIGTPA